MATIAEMFAIGLEPSGSKDPFALRRAANGVVKILAESGLPLTLAALETMASECLPRAAELWGSFLKERLDFYLREVRGYAYDVVNAVLSTGLTTVTDAIARAQALTQVRGSDDLLAISTAFKRIKNILRQAEEKQDDYGRHHRQPRILPRRPSNTYTRRRQSRARRWRLCAPGSSIRKRWNASLRYGRLSTAFLTRSWSWRPRLICAETAWH